MHTIIDPTPSVSFLAPDGTRYTRQPEHPLQFPAFLIGTLACLAVIAGLFYGPGELALLGSVVAAATGAIYLSVATRPRWTVTRDGRVLTVSLLGDIPVIDEGKQHLFAPHDSQLIGHNTERIADDELRQLVETVVADFNGARYELKHA